jgi:transposase
MHEREHFVTLLRDLGGGVCNPVQHRGRPRKALANVIFAETLTAFVGMSSRRAASDIRAAHEAGLMDESIAPKTLTSYLRDPALTDLLRVLIRESASPLASVEDRFAVDSTGFGTQTFDRWFDHKWGRERRKARFVKAHVIIGVNTHVISDVIVTGSDAGDAPQLPELVANRAGRFTVAEVSADKAYGSHRNYDAIESVGATPYIAFKSNTTGEGPALWRKMFGLFMYRSAEFKAHYHQRSNVEATFSAIKRTLGASLRSKNETAQHNEVLVKLLAHNLRVLVRSMYELGIAAEFWKQPSEEVGNVR